MVTPQEFLESFFKERAAAYAKANVGLRDAYTKYFGDPLLKRSDDLLLREKHQVEKVSESAGSAFATIREETKAGNLRTRYHLCPREGEWRIVRIEYECFRCSGTGKSGGMACAKCSGQGWYDPRKHAVLKGSVLEL